MRIRLSIALTIGRDRTPAAETRTVDLVGTHHEIPDATYPVGFIPTEEERRA